MCHKSRFASETCLEQVKIISKPPPLFQTQNDGHEELLAINRLHLQSWLSHCITVCKFLILCGPEFLYIKRTLSLLDRPAEGTGKNMHKTTGTFLTDCMYLKMTVSNTIR